MIAAAGTPDWTAVAAVIIGVFLTCFAGLVTWVFLDLRGDVKTAVNTLDRLVTELTDHDDRIEWLEGFHPTRRQLAQEAARRGTNGS